jgi:hypothetical protein
MNAPEPLRTLLTRLPILVEHERGEVAVGVGDVPGVAGGFDAGRAEVLEELLA